MFNLPEVGESVKVAVSGTVKSIIQYKDGEKTRFAVLVTTSDGDEYEFIVPGLGVRISEPGVSISKVPSTKYVTYNTPYGSGNFTWPTYT